MPFKRSMMDLGFVADWRNRSATSRTDLQLIDALSAIALLLGVALPLVEGFTVLLTERLSVKPVLLSILLSVACMVCAVAVIQAKDAPQAAAGTAATGLLGRPRYRFAPFARTVARGAFLASIALPLVSVYRSVSQGRPVPAAFYGYLLDGSDRPRPGLRLEVVSRGGTVLARSTYETDDRGFYIIRAREPIPRSARLRVVDATVVCGAGHLLPLAGTEQIPPPAGPTSVDTDAVVFRHRVACPASQ